MFARVADDGLKNNLGAQFVQPAGQIKGIGVLAEWGEQFRANSDDLNVHTQSVNDAEIKVGYCSGSKGKPWIFHDKRWIALVVARMTERPGAKARPTRLVPAT